MLTLSALGRPAFAGFAGCRRRALGKVPATELSVYFARTEEHRVEEVETYGTRYKDLKADRRVKYLCLLFHDFDNIEYDILVDNLCG